MKALGIFLGIMVVCALIPACTVMGSYNTFQRRDEQVKQAQTQLLSVYQKRSDLVGNLVETVKGASKHESGTLIQVAQARAGVANAKLPDNPTPEQLAAFDKAQSELRTALAGAMRLTVESNPTLQANQNFLKLQKQLQDVEGQSTAARNRYIREVTAYNMNVRSFPSNMVAGLFGYTIKPQLEFENASDIKKSPKVGF